MAEYDDESGTRRQWLVRGAGVLLGVAVLGGAAYFIIGSLGGNAVKKPTVQQVAILKQPPPPPPKPPEKLPEPPKVKEEVKIDQPKDEPRPDEPKPADDKPASDKPLGVDAEGSAGSDGFGLAASRGGRDLLSTGSGSSGRYYTGLLQRNFFEALARNRKAPQQEFSVIVSVWISDDGRVQRSEIVTGSGDEQVDSLIQSTLADMAPLREVPPSAFRQVRLRLLRRA